MKKIYSACGIAALALALLVPAASRAQTMMDAEGSASIGATVDGGPGAAPGSIRDRIRAHIQGRMQNDQNNQNYRNQVLQERYGSSSPHAMMGSTSRRMMLHGNGRGNFQDSSSTMMGSTTFMMRFGYEDNGRAMREDAFHARQNNVVRQLTVALNNLRNIRARVYARIQKAQASGRDMTNAITLLAVADAKIAIAQNAVNALSNISVTVSTTTATTTVSANASTSVQTTSGVDLAKPRQQASGAIQAIKDARRALNNVIVAVAHAMGFKVGVDGAITSPTPSPSITASPSATSSPAVTATPTPSATASPTASVSPTATATPTPTASSTATSTPTASPTPTH